MLRAESKRSGENYAPASNKNIGRIEETRTPDLATASVKESCCSRWAKTIDSHVMSIEGQAQSRVGSAVVPEVGF